MNPLNQPVKKWIPTILAGLAAAFGVNQAEVTQYIADHPTLSLIAAWLVYQIGQLLPSPVTDDPVAPYRPKPEPKGDPQ